MPFGRAPTTRILRGLIPTMVINQPGWFLQSRSTRRGDSGSFGWCHGISSRGGFHRGGVRRRCRVKLSWKTGNYSHDKFFGFKDVRYFLKLQTSLQNNSIIHSLYQQIRSQRSKWTGTIWPAQKRSSWSSIVGVTPLKTAGISHKNSLERKSLAEPFFFWQRDSICLFCISKGVWENFELRFLISWGCFDLNPVLGKSGMNQMKWINLAA